MSLFKLRKGVVKPFSALWLSHLLVEIFLLMHPALIPLFRKEFGLSLFEAGLLITIPNVCRLIIDVSIGAFADRYGSRPFIVLSLIISSLSGLLMSQSSNAFVLIFGLSLVMIAVTLYHPPGLRVLGNLLPDQAERSRAIGMHGASGCIGQSLGTITLGLLLTQLGWRNCYLLLSIPILTWAFILARIRMPQFGKRSGVNGPKTDEQPERPCINLIGKSSLLNLGFLLLVSSIGLNAMANSNVSAFMTTYLTSTENLSLDVASIIFGMGPVIGIIGSLAAGYLSSKFGDKVALTFFYLGQGIFLIGLTAVPHVVSVTFFFLMFHLFSAAVWIPAPSLVSSLVEKNRCGTAYSLFYFMENALGAIAPIVAALLIGGFGIMTPFFFAILLLVTSALMVQRIKMR